MASRILLRLVDEAILPAVLVVFTKLASLAIIIYALQLDWRLNTTSAFPSLELGNHEQLLMVNSLSNLPVLIVISLGLLWILLRAYRLHDTHVTPSLTLKLLSWNLTRLLGTSYEIYNQAIVWLSYLWLVFFLMIIHTVVKLNYPWITVAAFGLNLFLTWLFIDDVEREIT